KSNKNGMQLVVDGKDEKGNPKIIGKDGKGDYKTFNENGVFYVVPNINDDDLNNLRRGHAIDKKNDKLAGLDLTISGYKLVDKVFVVDPEGNITIHIDITATDYDDTGRTFFGDRPLDNPGYSTMVLGSTVQEKSDNKLDIFKVEQRLRYLGFPAF